jgi:TRAP-type C4-dicarboxylate transport system permease small subunit
MRYLAPIGIAAISGVILWKLLATIVLPLLGVLLGLFAAALKLGLIVLAIFFIYSLIRKRRDEASADARS